MISESSILDLLAAETLQFPPLLIRLLQRAGQTHSRQQFDALLELSWQEQTVTCIAEIKSQNTPLALRQAADSVLACSRELQPSYPAPLIPLLIVPYLSDAQLTMLESRQVSGIDLSGNGIIIAPGKLLVRKTGNPNAYPQSTPIRNIYNGTSSLVPRTLLSRPTCPSANEFLTEIQRRGGSITLPTISKVLKSLQDDLIISRDQGIQLIQAEKLLDNLLQNYRPPQIRSRWLGKTTLNENQFIAAASKITADYSGKIALTGIATGMRTVVAGREPLLSVYSTLIPDLFVKKLSLETSDRFPNVEILCTDEPAPFFDLRPETGIPFASPIQCYLEMAQGEKRTRDLSAQLRNQLLAALPANIQRTTE